MASLFGWDLLASSVAADINNNEDILVCLTHLVLVSNGFKCIGVGESKNMDGTEPKSEALPRGWNTDYALRYVYQGRLYNLKGTIVDDALMVNLFRVDERKVGVVQLNSSAVAQREGSLQEMIPEHETLVDTIKRQMIDSVVISQKSRDGTTQTESEVDRTPLNIPSRRYVPEPLHPLPLHPVPDFPGGGLGSRDLDPFNGMDPLAVPPRLRLPHQGGSGMLFQPPQPDLPFGPGPDMPPGALPPGARFDPYRPPDGRGPRRPNRPDNDEFPPPGYDDMFM